MKKIKLLVLICLFVFPFIRVDAATTPKVLTLEGTTSGTSISYNGTTEEGSTAVMCKLLNTDSEELDMLSPFLRPAERLPEVPVVSREHLPQLEKIQEVLPSHRTQMAENLGGDSRLRGGIQP